MRKLWIMGLVLLLTLLTNSAYALEVASPQFSSGQDPIEQGESTRADVRVIPSSGAPGSTHTIIITGLQAGENITVQIRQDASGEQVYSTTRTAESNGRVQFDIFTTLDDAPGSYTVEALSRSGQLLGSGTMTITELPGRDGIATVEPQEAEAGETFAFAVTAVRPFADLEFVVRDAAGQQVFSIRVRADVDGNASTSYPSAADLIGTFTLLVRDGRDQVATATFNVVEQVFAVETTITPETPYPLDEVFVSLTGLEAGVPVLAEVLLEGAVVNTYPLTGDENGTAIFSFALERDVQLGDYEIRVVRDGELISRALYTVDLPPITAEVTPTEGLPGTRFIANVSGMLPDEVVTVELFKDGAALVSLQVTASAEGTARALLGQRMTLEPGNYAVRVLRGETVSFSTPVAIVTERTESDVAVIDPAQVMITVDPLSGPVPTNYTLRVEGVPADTDLTLAIVYQGRSILTLRGTADADGLYETVVTSEETDPPGTYTFEVRANGELLGSVDFAIADETAQATPEATPPPAEGAMLVINPSTIARGETFVLSVGRLNAGEAITIDIVLDGESIFTTERTASENGSVTLDLQAEESDTAGTYGVVVIRADGSTLQGAFTIVEAASAVTPTPIPATPVPPADGEIVISPAQAVAGSVFSVEAAGFPTGARVDVEVRFNGEVIFSEIRNADINGIVRTRITSAADAAQGEYQVVLLRSGEVVASASYIIGEGGAVVPTSVPTATPIPTESAQTAQVTVSAEPASGPTGTTHTVSVSGATPGAELTFDVRFGGNSVFQTTRTVDANGVAVVILVTESGDPAGLYEVVVSDASGVTLGSAQFTLESQITVEPTSVPTVEPQPAQVTVTVDPASGPIRTTHTVTVTGATAGAELSFDVRFGGSSVYQTTRTVDANGAAVLVLVSEDGDPAGVYEIVVSDASGVTLASATLTVEVQQGESTPIVPPTPAPTEEAQTGDVTITASPLSGAAGTTHVITVSGVAAGTEVLFDVRFAGNTVYRTSRVADANGQASVSLVTDASDSPGVYEVLVSTTSGSLGSAQFLLEDSAQPTPEPTEEVTPEPTAEPTVEPTREPSSGGNGTSVITGQISPDMPEYRYSFEGMAGETLLISSNSSDFDSYLRLLDVNGVELAANDDAGGTLNSQIGPFTLSASGTYTVVVTSYGYYSYSEVATGSFELFIERIAVSQIGYGETRQINLDAQTISQFLRFSGTAGDVISVTADSGGSIDTVLSVIDPDGVTVFSDDDGGAGFDPEIVRYVLPFSGEYTLVLRAFSAGDSGSVNLALERSDSRSLDGETRIVRLNSKQVQDVLTLNGSAGQTVGLEVRLQSGDVGNLSIIVEQAGVQLMYYSTSGVPESIVLGFEVPVDGDVTIRIEDYSTTGSTYEFLIRP